jgi:heme/copper-type cytochrome/quinol oxidase subunit 4
MSATEQSKESNGMATTYVVYIAILGMAVYQVCFAIMAGPQPLLMLMLALLQAAIAVTYFMHLGQERTVLFLALIPYTLFVLFMMNMIWSDSFRLLYLRPH